METAEDSKHYTPKERQAQLQNTEILYDAGLHNSVLLITGIHLSTVRKEEGWFHSRALLRYAQCLSKLQEHQRSTAYYEEASYHGTSPIPSDLLKTENTQDQEYQGTRTMDNGASTEKSASARPLTTAEQMLLEAKLDRATTSRERQARENVKDQLVGLASSIAAIQKKAAILSAAKATQAANPLSTGLTKTAPVAIPDVKLRSTTMKRHVGSVKSQAQSLKRLSAAKDTKLGPRTTPRSVALPPASGSANVGSYPSDKSVEQYTLEAKILHARACCESKEYWKAGDLISHIPENKWTVEVFLLMIQLIRNRVVVKLTEKACWESIAEIQPLAIEAYIQLLRLQVPLAIVLNMIPSESPEKHWMKTYLQGMDNIYRMRYQGALSDFSTLDEKYPRNTNIKLRMAVCLRWMGKYVRAGLLFAQVRKLDTRICDDMFHYGVCLKHLSKMKYINKLANDLMNTNDKHPDAWCVLALYWDMKGSKEKALQIAMKALQLRPDHCGALQLRGQLYLELPPPSPAPAIQAFREAYMIEKDIATYEGLVNAYILMGRQQEAVGMAMEVKTLMPESAHALAIYGSAIYHRGGENNTKEAQDALQEALRMDPGCVQAACGLVMIYGHLGQYDDAIQMLVLTYPMVYMSISLEKQIDHQPPDTVHVNIAELYTATEKWEDAYKSYREAISCNPDNERAKEGMAHAEKIINGGDDEEDEDSFDAGDDHDDMNSDLDLALNRAHSHIDEDDILTGDEGQGEDYGDHYHPHHQQTPYQRARGFEYQQTPVGNPQRPPDHAHYAPVRLNHRQAPQQYRSQPAPHIHAAGYPPSPSRPRSPNPFRAQREREYEEVADSEDDMDDE
ncbi:Anaphase-promoting complex subunit 7 [Mortierella sp. GBA30]|nr:Anaphase-promoting complex subunit 7 [Mortierella sp. GBA30]